MKKKLNKICHFNMTQEENFKNICDLTTTLMGFKNGELSIKSRKRPLQIARSVAAYIGLKEENINRNIIAKVLDRDRAVTYHYENSHKGNYASCIIYRNTFNKVYTAFKNIDKSKKTFLDGDFMKRYLLKNGVKESVKPQVFIEVTSGEVKCIIQTSYFEFSNQIDFIKFALRDYHYTFKIL
jgi:hypothetical protein